MAIRTAQAQPYIFPFIITNTHQGNSMTLDHISDKISDAAEESNTMHVHSLEIFAAIADKRRSTG
jgi:hypothetical protein